MSFRRARLVTAVILCCPALAGCLTWQPRWTAATAATASEPAALNAALAASDTAVDAAGLRRAMAAYEGVLGADPQNPTALVRLADHSILMATAYTSSRAEKRRLYDRAMALAEQAMYTHPEFRRLADAGARPWEAAHVLGEGEMRAMMTWMTALLYRFKETMGTPARVANVRWIARLDPMLDRMEQLDESWENGAVPFTRAFYYFVLPPSMGGDRALAARSFDRALELGPQRWIHRWGRARFFHVLTGNRAGFVEDLEWVVAQDPATSGEWPAWAAYIGRDAEALLAEVDRHFQGP